MVTIALRERGISCHACGWSHDGPTLQHDEDHAFQYEVREFGSLIGWITADRARSHPGMMWECKRVGESKPFACDFKSVQEALTAF